MDTVLMLLKSNLQRSVYNAVGDNYLTAIRGVSLDLYEAQRSLFHLRIEAFHAFEVLVVL